MPNAISVSQLNGYISRILKSDPLLNNMYIKGEISGLNFHKTGHIYFSLIDEKGKVNCSIWKSNVPKIKGKLEEGAEVLVFGDINVYGKNGSYSISVKNVKAMGDGDLLKAFYELKEKLEKQGLFDKAIKKPLPEFPKKVGVVTSATGAAIEDIKRIITEKNSLVDILIFPTMVQGGDAPRSIIENIELANKRDDIDVLIVGRGGGSKEDLSCFNDEGVALAIYNSKIPIISAVGHESDFSISDFVADVRAETPTAAANIAVYDGEELTNKIYELLNNMVISLRNLSDINRERADSYINSMHLNLKNRILGYEKKLDNLKLLIDENNPLNILDKGYSLILDENMITLKSIDDISIEKVYDIKMKDGTAKAQILSKERG
ncbi:MAG TPA: exodeoxyribonuclease VII large subunit [Anaerovoracaceae bacterium]|nr:exodeoxyribonuclease VII large subunit [Anaerovoracaceae bacterium]